MATISLSRTAAVASLILCLILCIALVTAAEQHADNDTMQQQQHRQQKNVVYRQLKGSKSGKNYSRYNYAPIRISPFQNDENLAHTVADAGKGKGKGQVMPTITLDDVMPETTIDSHKSSHKTIYKAITPSSSSSSPSKKGDSSTLLGKKGGIHKKKHSKSSKKNRDKNGTLYKVAIALPRESDVEETKPETTVTPPTTVDTVDSLSCSNKITAELQAITGLITASPEYCCSSQGHTAVIVTHAIRDESTGSGLELFWDRIYNAMVEYFGLFGTCFVMTGIDPALLTEEQSLEDVLIAANSVASNNANVPVIMTTDPTDGVRLVQAIRAISNNPVGPNIGIFNAGYNNIVLEAIVTGSDRLPFIGLLDDAEFGTKAAEVTRALLQSRAPVPLCFNPRPDLQFLAQRCEAYYSDLGRGNIDPVEGRTCSSNSTTVDSIVEILMEERVNAVWTHVECCSVVGEAVQRARQMGQDIIVGCQDADTTDGLINFVTAQPIELEAYNVATWANFPVLQSKQGLDGRGSQYFPGLLSLINTEVYSVLTL